MGLRKALHRIDNTLIAPGRQPVKRAVAAVEKTVGVRMRRKC